METKSSHSQADSDSYHNNSDGGMSFVFDKEGFEARMGERLSKLRNRNNPENNEIRPSIAKENYRS